METSLAIRTRRSIRSFKNRPVSKRKIERILECGLAAPSSKNSNPWYFLAVRGKKKNQIADWTAELVNKRNYGPSDPVTGKVLKTATDSTAASVKIIKEANALILIFNRAPFTKNIGTVVKNLSSKTLYTYLLEIVGIGAAVENMLLAAHGLNLGAVFLCDIYPAQKMIKKFFKIKYDLVGAIALGHPAYRLPPRALENELIQLT